MAKNFLVVDDQKEIVDVIKAYLQKEGYNIYPAYNGKDAIDILNQENIDFAILDLMLPDISGEEICKKIRLRSQIPVIMLTAKSMEEDRIYGLDIGADDYIVKPFSPKELLARIRAILRRSSEEFIKADIIQIDKGNLSIDLNSREVTKSGKIIDLTPTEFDLLKLFSQNPSKVFSRENLIIKILGYDYEGYDRTIDAHVKNLRHKIEDKENKYIKTVYGVGYKFRED
ncbi:response regulator transcription factor [Clostridium sp. D2Q-11]|uniref:Response regulator transcription factor n=1 Tax=Anaeromonas frigoriresistens TaxID=2683708 RepID=A0A942Z6V7_9FIRM|nr:response regulator transcription factor [Anaeromonas frigoriresistens]MBS4538881.1 response regulator transcription factor [Anaeromonas frigoriresistens]